MAILACIVLFSVYTNPAFANLMRSNTTVSKAGYFQLSWGDEDASLYTVQQSLDDTFKQAKTIYQGSDEKMVISGLPNGRYFYRMQAKGGDWSNVIAVEVAHHTLQKALIFFAIGAVMLLILVSVLIKGNRDAQN